MDEETTEYPFTVTATGLPGVDLYINTNIDWEDTEMINSLLAVNTTERSTHLYEIIAEPYTPYCPDVVEKAYNIGNLATTDNPNPVIYGAIYGGSALGNVNNAAADLTRSSAQAVMQAMGSGCKYRRSFAHSLATHLLLCGPVPNRASTGLWPRGWGLWG